MNRHTKLREGGRTFDPRANMWSKRQGKIRMGVVGEGGQAPQKFCIAAVLSGVMRDTAGVESKDRALWTLYAKLRIEDFTLQASKR
jgi:hypothetical protein